MEKKLVLSHEVLTRELSIEENDFTSFEALGILKAAKPMITADWLNDE